MKDLTGLKFNNWTVISLKGKDNGTHRVWLCKCKCGNKRIVVGTTLNSGESKSCGCIKRELLKQSSTTHGMKYTKFYTVFRGMLDRCGNPNNRSYKHYGGRGIKVEWKSFEEFMADMLKGYKEGLTIERINNNGNYCKENCKWITNKEQQKNKRNNHLITYKGKTQCITAWAEEYKISHFVIAHRLKYGWPIKKVLTSPLKNNYLITYKGKTQRLAKWAVEYKINRKVLWYRLKNWPIKKALTFPIQEQKRKIK